MSNLVRSTRCRPSEHRSHRWITLMMIVAMVSFAGLVFADSGAPVKTITAQGAKQLEANPENGPAPAGDSSGGSGNAASLAVTLPLPGDTCANAIPLTLNRLTKANSAGNYGVHCSLNTDRACSVDLDCAATFSLPNEGVCIRTAACQNDYQTPADATCYSGINNIPTTAPGRDVVFSFTAPAAGKYTFQIIDRNEGLPFAQAFLLYLTDCANSGTVNCIRGVNRSTRNPALAGSSNGFNNNTSEALDCHQMNAGETVYAVYDDLAPGACSNNAHACRFDSDCGPGNTCTPTLNAGGPLAIEVRPCDAEVEPNDTPAQANPFVCGVVGQAHVAPVAHCYLGTRAGNVCTRIPGTFLDQSVYDANMRCNISNTKCVVDLVTGLSNCPGGELCQSQTDLDCDPRCDVGPRAGLTCTSQAFCNPVSDQGATCSGSCQIEQTCVDNTTGLDTGVACTPVCVGGSFPGRFCSGLSGCPGGGVCTQTPVVPAPGATCVTGQTCTRSYNEGDADFYSLGVLPAGSTVFAAVDASASSDGDWRMRVNNDTQTLQFDDDDGFTRICQSSAVIAGAVNPTGGPTYLQVSRTNPRTSAVYELNAHVRPPLAQAQLEDESGPIGNDIYYTWPGDLPHINPIDNGADNGYIRGTFAFQQDSDCFKFLINEGDLMDWYGATNPQRAPVAVALISHPQPIIYDPEPAGISNFVFGANARKNTTPNVVQPGLKAVSPAVTSEYHQWRAVYTGLVEICYYDASPIIGTGVPTYPNNWSGSLTVNCGPVQAAGPGTTTTDVSVVKTGPSTATTGDFIDYTISFTNTGTEIAQEVTFDDTLDANLTYISLSVDDGFGGANVVCFSLPTPGTNDAPVSCMIGAIAPGDTVTATLTVQVNNCIGSGVVIDNAVTIVTVSTDPNPANDFSSAPSLTTVAAPANGCQDIVCNLTPGINTCIQDLCTANDTCNAGVCESGAAPNCDDSSLCTDDSCSSLVGCVNDSSQAGDLCDDFNDCTQNACDPVNFCVFPNEPAGAACDDGQTCTNTDVCDGAGTCGGTSVCDDGNPCTIDSGDEGNACACTNLPGPAGVACSDGNACTGTAGTPDACDNAGGCVGGAVVTCDDSDSCTTDSCDASLGCVFTPVVCAPPDQCHAAGVCAGGACGYAPLPNGTTCDDGNSGTTNDVCTGGVCVGGSACDTQPTPKPEGYYKKLCKGGHGHPHAGDALTDADAVCVGQLTDTFAGISTVDEICAEWDHDSTGHHDTNGAQGKECETKAERELMALALNICRDRVCLSQEVDSNCGSDPHDHTLTTVQESLDTVDDILSDPARYKAVCKTGKCLAKEINNGKALHHTSLTLTKVVGPGNKIRLEWDSPVFEDGSGEASSYTVWRRVLNADAVFVKLTETSNLTYVDATAGTGTFEYEVTFTIEP